MTSAYGDALRTTFRSATRRSSGATISKEELNLIVEYAHSENSTSTKGMSLAKLVTDRYGTYPAKLSEEMAYLAYSGRDRYGRSSWDNVLEYKSSHPNSGVIGDTPWGTYVKNSGADVDMARATRKLDQFLKAHDIKPAIGTAANALEDSLWTFGSGPYIDNAILSKRPIVAFVDGAPQFRGFSDHELPRLVRNPNVIVNGRPMSTVAGDPLASTAESADHFQAVRRETMLFAGKNTGRMIEGSEFGRHVDFAYGYDATNDSLFGQPRQRFQAKSLIDMGEAAHRWSANRAFQLGDIHYRAPIAVGGMELIAPLLRDTTAAVSSITPRADGQIHETHRYVATIASGRPSGATPAGVVTPQIGKRAVGIAGEIALATDGVYSLYQSANLSAAYNHVGAQSEIIHLASRNLSAWGGAVLGAEVGAAVGVESGPGTLVTGAVGGLVGMVGGERIARAVDDYRTHHQSDSQGSTWRMDPARPEQGWTRDVVSEAMPGVGFGPHAVSGRTITADAELANELNYKASGVHVQLALATPPTPRDPYTQKADATDMHSLRNADWRRDPATDQWSRRVTDGYLEHGMARSHRETATPERAAQLDRAAADVIAENRANQPRAIAERYLESHRQFGWDRFGPPEAAAIHASQAPKNVSQASDGNEYLRGQDGQWTHESWLGVRSQATGNLKDELDAVAPSQAPHQRGLRRGLAQSMHDGDALEMHAQQSSASRSELGERLGRMLDAASLGDWDTFRKDTQALANMPPGQTMHAQSVVAVDRMEQVQAHEAQLQAQQAQQQQEAQQQQSRSHGMTR